MARDGAPRDLGPRAFWQDTLRAAGCDLETLDAAFAARMEAEVEAQRDAIDALPRIGGGVSADGSLVAVLDRDADPAWRFLVAVRRGPEVDDSGVFMVRGRVQAEDWRRVRFHVPGSLVGASRFEVAFSVITEPGGWPYAEPWRGVSR